MEDETRSVIQAVYIQVVFLLEWKIGMEKKREIKRYKRKEKEFDSLANYSKL